MKRLAIAWLSIAALLAAPAARAEDVKPAPNIVTVVESFTGADPARMLGGALLVGEEGPWTLRQKPGAYLMENTTSKGAIKFFHLRLNDPQGAQPTLHRAIEAEIEAVGEENFGGAGIICRYDRQSSTYVMFLINAAGRYLVVARGADGKAKPVANGRSAAIKKSGTNRVAAIYDGNATQFFINGTAVLKHSNPAIVGQEFGIAAAGIGRFRFERVVMKGEREPAEKRL